MPVPIILRVHDAGCVLGIRDGWQAVNLLPPVPVRRQLRGQPLVIRSEPSLLEAQDGAREIGTVDPHAAARPFPREDAPSLRAVAEGLADVQLEAAVPEDLGAVDPGRGDEPGLQRPEQQERRD